MRDVVARLPNKGLGVCECSKMLNLAEIEAALCRDRAEMVARTRVPMYLVKGDEADLAVLSRLKEHAVWLATEAQAKIVEIDDARQRIERGTYGICARCQRAIPEERISALPLTLYCVSCQSHIEHPHRK